MPQNKEAPIRENREEILAPFTLNIGNDIDKMLAVVTGGYQCPSIPGEPDKITESIKKNESFRTANRMRGEQNEEEDNNSFRTVSRKGEQFHPSYRESNVQEIAKYSSIVNELDRYRFADDDSRRERQMTYIISTIKTALQELTIRDVAFNTRQAFKEHVDKVIRVNGGIQVNFNFNGTKISVAARGAFTGDETVAIYRQGEKVAGAIIRIEEDGEQTNLSANYGITIEET